MKCKIMLSSNKIRINLSEISDVRIELAETIDLKLMRNAPNGLIKKGVPISKEKVNNKKILLTISPDLKKIASLSAILQLREL